MTHKRLIFEARQIEMVRTATFPRIRRWKFQNFTKTRQMTERQVRFEMFATRHCFKIARSFFIGTPKKRIGCNEHCMLSNFFGKPNVNMEASITCSSLCHDWCLEFHFVQINSFLYKRIDGEKIIFSILLWKPIASRQQRALTFGCCSVQMLLSYVETVSYNPNTGTVPCLHPNHYPTSDYAQTRRFSEILSVKGR